jgi:trimethylguanosine synthase
MEVDTHHSTCEAPADLHPGLAFLFAGGNAEAAHKENEKKHHQIETTVRTLSVDPIFAHNHGFAGEGTVKMKKFHHPPVGKYKYTAPLAELPAFFSGDAGVYDSKLAEQKTVDSDAQADNGGGLDSFFDDFVTTAPPPKESAKSDNSQDHNTLILRTPTKTVVKTVISSSDNLTAGKCICQARYDNLKKGASQPNPHDPSVVHDKYWAQRRRLFKKFDEGIQLDAEGWYSVTPEVVADHVGSRFVDAAGSLIKYNSKGKSKKQSKSMVILDAFCGCGGNAIAFAKLPASVVSLIICIDVDRTKLRKAAHNASIYNIPPHRIVFVEANSVAVMERCYRDGVLVMDPPPRTAAELSKYPPREIYDDFTIGGIDLLAEYAPRIDAIFMDPPWGGMDYGATGKDGYDLARDMKIRGCERGCVGFPPTPEIDGFRLLKIAAAATSTRFVMYDLPRNANKRSLAEAALEAGYGGNCKLEEHYLNGRLKTVTAYFGQDFSKMLDSKPDLV